MKYYNQIQSEFQKLALQPQSLISPKIHNFTSNNNSRIDPTTYEIIIKTNKHFCHEHCLWLNRKKSIPLCKLFNTQLDYNDDSTKQAIINKNCLLAITHSLT